MPHIAIIGAGISGLATAHFLRERLPDASLTVLERDEVPGGKVRTHVREGYRVEAGPNGFVSHHPATRELIASLGLEGKLVAAAVSARRRYLFMDGRLRPLPSSPATFIRSGLLSIPGKLRAATEPLLPHRSHHEESVHAFMARHFGHEAARVLAEPMVLGVAAGDAHALSLDALFPNLRTLERSHGSLVKGMLARRRRDSPGQLTGFSGGTGELIAALAHARAGELQCAVAAEAFEPTAQANGRGLHLTLSNGERPRFDAVVMAGPADVSAQLLRPHAPAAALQLETIPSAGVRVFGLGFERIDVPHPLDGFGFLVGRGQGLRILGVLWSSTLFPGRAPAGRVLLRVISGGAVDPEFMVLSDDDALEQVMRDLRISMGISVAPDFVEQISWRRGIPQYLLGHRQRVAAARSALPAGVFLVGDAYDGVGINDCIRAARNIADEIVAWLEQGTSDRGLRGRTL